MCQLLSGSSSIAGSRHSTCGSLMQRIEHADFFLLSCRSGLLAQWSQEAQSEGTEPTRYNCLLTVHYPSCSTARNKPVHLELQHLPIPGPCLAHVSHEPCWDAALLQAELKLLTHAGHCCPARQLEGNRRRWRVCGMDQPRQSKARRLLHWCWNEKLVWRLQSWQIPSAQNWCRCKVLLQHDSVHSTPCQWSE